MRPGGQLEQHRDQPQAGHGVLYRLTLGGQLSQRRAHEDPDPLIGRADHGGLTRHLRAAVAGIGMSFLLRMKASLARAGAQGLGQVPEQRREVAGAEAASIR